MEDKKISKSRQKKIQIVTELNEKLAKAKALVFTNYQGLTHKQLEGLKKVLKDLNAELVVTKNTLLARALQISNFKFQISNLEGPTATLFVYDDVIAPLKQIAKTIKSLGLPASRQDGPSIKFGIIDNQALTGDQVLKLAMLPSREVLLAQVVFGLKSPIFGLHRALNFNLQRLVITLSAIRQNKS